MHFWWASRAAAQKNAAQQQDAHNTERNDQKIIGDDPAKDHCEGDALCFNFTRRQTGDNRQPLTGCQQHGGNRQQPAGEPDESARPQRCPQEQHPAKMTGNSSAGIRKSNKNFWRLNNRTTEKTSGASTGSQTSSVPAIASALVKRYVAFIALLSPGE